MWIVAVLPVVATAVAIAEEVVVVVNNPNHPRGLGLKRFSE